MNFVGERRWDSGGDGCRPMGHAPHGGSAPNLLCSQDPGGGAPHCLEKQLSAEMLRGWGGRTPAPHLGSLGSLGKGLNLHLNLSLGLLKWPSLVSVGRWRHHLSERLLKRHGGAGGNARVVAAGEAGTTHTPPPPPHTPPPHTAKVWNGGKHDVPYGCTR